jgi:hypothetical protein
MGAWAKLSLEPPVPEDSVFNLNPVAGGVCDSRKFEQL